MVVKYFKSTLRHSKISKISKDTQRHPKQLQRHPNISKISKDIQSHLEKPRVPKMLWEIFNYLGCSVSKGAFPDTVFQFSGLLRSSPGPVSVFCWSQDQNSKHYVQASNADASSSMPPPPPPPPHLAVTCNLPPLRLHRKK